MTRSAVVLVASTRAAAGTQPDTTGPRICDWLTERAFVVGEPQVTADGEPLAAELDAVLNAGPELVIITGGTGIGPADRTVEAVEARLDFVIPGIGEEMRRRGAATVPSALLSRAVAGVVGTTLVVTLPGSRGGVADGLAVLDEVLDHALDQLRGVDHRQNR